MTWRVAVAVPDGRTLEAETVDLGAFGAKVRLDERLRLGSPARVRLFPPDGDELLLEAVVWRTDEEGPIFVFVGVGTETFSRLKSLVGELRGH